jgi:hypothetical protein
MNDWSCNKIARGFVLGLFVSVQLLCLCQTRAAVVPANAHECCEPKSKPADPHPNHETDCPHCQEISAIAPAKITAAPEHSWASHALLPVNSPLAFQSANSFFPGSFLNFPGDPSPPMKLRLLTGVCLT